MLKLFAMLLMVTTALAQERPQPPETIPAVQVQQAMGQKLIEEVTENVKLRAQILQLQDQLKKEKTDATSPSAK